ncbi:MAG TPA: branched-chain amino acid ABC transporter substrate-binding protein [Gemmatimonadales bacterium]|nr:branched-chain amino acid ABC transporter substrate-binding protein [Gemmatimonadales bacterium]
MATRRTSFLSLAFLAALAGCGGHRTAGDTVVIGVTGPFSQPRGVSMRLGAILARDEINRAGGIGGRQVELVFADDSASNDAAVRIATAFRDDPRVVAVIGHLTSDPTIAAAPIYNDPREPMALISPSASAPALTTEGGAAVFRICPTDFGHGQALARYARNVLHARTAAVLYENTTYGRGVAQNFREDFVPLGGTVVTEDPYNKQLATFEPYLSRLQRRGGADVILIAGVRDGAERIVATRDSLRLRTTLLAGDGVIGIEASGRAEGMYISSAWLPDRPDAASQAFVKAYREANAGATPDHRGAGAYDIMHILARAITEVGPDRHRVVEYLAGLGSESPAYDGVTGRISFDAQGDAKEKPVAIGVVRNKVLVTARE